MATNRQIIDKAYFEARVLKLYRSGVAAWQIAERMGHRCVVEDIIREFRRANSGQQSEAPRKCG